MIHMAAESYSGVVETVPEMRHWLGKELSGHDAADTALLLADELAANAVQHTRDGYTVLAVWDREQIYVSVTDHGSDTLPALPCPRPHADQDLTDPDESGRGLFLVRSLADRWGVTDTGHGCDVWFEVAEHS